MSVSSKAMSFSSKAAAVGGIGAIFALVLRERKESRNGKRTPTTFGWDGGSWSVGQSRRSNEASGQLAVKGIKNLGNTCFLNAVLQSLGSFPVFREYLEDLQALSTQPLDKNHTPEGDSPFTFELLNLMNDLKPWVPPTPPLVPVDATKLRKLLSKQVGAFGKEDQQDAQELFQMVMRLLGEEAALCLQRHKGASEIGAAGLQGLISSTPQTRHVPENPLRGTLTHLRHCRGCQEKSIRSSPFVDLSLTLPEARNHLFVGPVNLEKVLEDFTQEQLVEDVECPTCAMRSAMDEDRQEEEEIVVPPKRVPADMRMLLASLPKTLCLHFPRRHQSPSGSEMKLQQRVVFPLHLNVAPFCCTGGSHTDSIGMSTALQMKNKIASSLTQLTPGRTTKTTPGAPAPSPAAKALQSPQPHHVGKQPLVGGSAEGASAVGSRKERYVSSPSGGTKTIGSGSTGGADGHNSIDGNVSSNEGGMDYDLRAVIVHQGGADSGHYTAFRKLESNQEEAVQAPDGPKVVHKPPGGKREGVGEGKEEWVYISDEDVERGVSESRVLSSQAYMLFYRQRITEAFNRGVS